MHIETRSQSGMSVLVPERFSSRRTPADTGLRLDRIARLEDRDLSSVGNLVADLATLVFGQSRLPRELLQVATSEASRSIGVATGVVVSQSLKVQVRRNYMLL